MLLSILCQIFILIALFLSIIIICFIFNKIYKKHTKKIEILNRYIENKNNNKTEIKIKSYCEFSKIAKCIYDNTNPYTLSIFAFVKNNSLKNINIKLIYHIISDENDDCSIFTDNYEQIPISNIDIISCLYQIKRNILIDDISELSEYDNGLYEFLNKKGIKSLVLINIFNKNTKPIGFFALTYKDNFITKDGENFVTNESKKISEYLINILKW